MCAMDPLKSVFISFVLMLVYLGGISRAQQSFHEFSPDTPSTCGSTKILNDDAVFLISDVLSSESRINNARPKRTAYFESSSPDRDYDSPFSVPPPSKSSSNVGSPTLRSLTRSRGRISHPSKRFSLGNMESEYKNKLSQLYPEDDDDNELHVLHNEEKKPGNFYNFMQRRFTSPYRNELRRFPAQPSRLGTNPTKKPRKKDMMAEVPGAKVEEKHRDFWFPHGNRREKPGKLPAFAEHILSKNRGEFEANSSSTDMQPRSSSPHQDVAERRGIEHDEPLKNHHNDQLEDILGSLEPKKIQKLKRLLGTVHSNEERNTGRRYLADEGENGRSYSYEDGPKMHDEDENDGRRQSNLDGYPNRRRAFGRKRHFGDVSHERDYENPWIKNSGHAESSENSDFLANEAPPDAVEDSSESAGRKKRDISPNYALDKVAGGKGVLVTSENLTNDTDNDVLTCRWKFKKGNDCAKMVLRMQYWIDGVRDCKKEYMVIRADVGGLEAKLCGGQEDHSPYIIEGDTVLIEHFRDTTAGPGLTKFKGTVQCEEVSSL